MSTNGLYFAVKIFNSSVKDECCVQAKQSDGDKF